jgi:hypothetical protein
MNYLLHGRVYSSPHKKTFNLLNKVVETEIIIAKY